MTLDEMIDRLTAIRDSYGTGGVRGVTRRGAAVTSIDAARRYTDKPGEQPELVVEVTHDP
jgi:hypothetical protein